MEVSEPFTLLVVEKTPPPLITSDTVGTLNRTCKSELL